MTTTSICANVSITALAFEGAGIAHLADGKTVFVAGAVPGDHVRICVQEQHPRYARATIVEVLEPSPERVAPACPYHALCGGCNLQQVSYAEQMRSKRRFVVDALTHIAALPNAESLVADICGSQHEWNYRNKIELEPVFIGKRLSLGLHAKHSSEVVPVKNCLLLPKGLTDLPGRLAGALGFACRDTDAAIKRVGIRVSPTAGDIELALWTEPGPCNRSFVAKVLGDALKTTSLVRVLAAGALEKRDVRKVEVLGGRGFWTDDLGEYRYRVSAPSFFQVNSSQARCLVEQALTGLDLADAHVADLYSGVGTFTLPLAERAGQVTAIEMAGSSIRDLRRNLIENGLDAEVIGGGVEHMLPDLDDVQIALVDPPRSGLTTNARRAIVDAAPQTLVYVSCNPTTLARDIKELIQAGYRLVTATPVDLFPQTHHIETVARLVR
ncbi:MAG: 23S rRNA (uracil(1939)-C(5))-methyltransferase RlmD [Coriobacteriales bacterium]|nr:23S rRNA (uracil(1939)-C(5))-methyltransferase RlmD [Coriobacteriales bacterium]